MNITTHWRLSKKLLLVSLVFAVVLPMAGVALAASYDLTIDYSKQPSLEGDPGWRIANVNGAWWQTFGESISAGTGTFNTYLQIQAKGSTAYERGYNSNRTTDYLDDKSPQTIALPLSAVPVVLVDPDGPDGLAEAQLFKEFVVDVNQTAGNHVLSVDWFQIWQTNNPALAGYDETTKSFSSGATKVYDIAEHTLLLDYWVNAGSGKHDYRLLVPNSWFDPEIEYVTIVAYHGYQSYPCDDGFEEWGVRGIDYASKTGKKWHDLNANGVRDAGEPGLSGWTIYVDYDDNTTFDPGEPSAVTGADGTYTLNGILPGDWWVREQAPAGETGWIQSYPGGVDRGHYETFVGKVNNPDNNFGNYKLATKSGTKFHDLNANGVKDAGEPGLPGWTINLVGTDGMGNQVSKSTTTDSSGNYSFSVLPGTYAVSEELKTDWYQSYPAGGVWNITLTSGQVDAVNDFGNYQKIKISGYKWNDQDGDGEWLGEPALNGWEIYLDLNNDGDWDAGEPKTTTDQDGYYEFTGLMPGDYRVREVLQDGWTQTYPTTGIHILLGLKSGDNPAGFNFGNMQPETKTATLLYKKVVDGDDIPLQPTASYVKVGTVVYDTATVTSLGGTPTGNVQFYVKAPSAAAYVAFGAPVPLVSGVATSGDYTVNMTGMYQFKAAYAGGGVFLPSESIEGEEPLGVVEAKIELRETDVNAVGDPHTFTAKVLADYGDGEGFVPVAGAWVGFDFLSAVNVEVLSTTTNAAGEAWARVNSASPTVVTANATVTRQNPDVPFNVLGVPFNLTTAGGSGVNGPQTKTWVDARSERCGGNATLSS